MLNLLLNLLAGYTDFVTVLFGKLFLRVVFVDFINFSPFCQAYGKTKGGSPFSEYE